MKIQISLLSLLILFGITACRQHKEAATTAIDPGPDSAAGVEALPDPGGQSNPHADSTEINMRFIVSFFSIGSGIARGGIEKMQEFVDRYSKKISKEIGSSMVPWGREGERDYCFALPGLSKEEADGFVDGLRDALKSVKQVSFMENQPCRKPRLVR